MLALLLAASLAHAVPHARLHDTVSIIRTGEPVFVALRNPRPPRRVRLDPAVWHRPARCPPRGTGASTKSSRLSSTRARYCPSAHTGAVVVACQHAQEGDPLPIAVVEAIEGLHAITTGHLVALDWQHVAQCCPAQTLSWSIYGCIAKLGGVCAAGASANNCSANACTPAATPTGFQHTDTGNTTSLQAAVYINPVAAGIDAASLETYTGGVFQGPCGTSVDHVVLVVGWGVQGSTPYWIIKNSWVRARVPWLG